MRRLPVRANRGVPIQKNIIEAVDAALRADGYDPNLTIYRPVQFTLQIPFRSIIWSTKNGKPFTPPSIEYALQRAEKKRLPTTIPVKFRLVTKPDGGGHFRRRSAQSDNKFPYKLAIYDNSWGDAAKSTLTHELTHFAQYIGTALLLFADAPSDNADAYREAFASVDMGRLLYGTPRREARTGIRQARTYQAGRASDDVRTGQHAMLDQEYQTNAQTWADRFLESSYFRDMQAALRQLGYRDVAARLVEERSLPVLASQLGKYLAAFAKRTHIPTDTKRWRQQAELAYEWVLRRLGASEIQMKVTDTIREKLHQTPLSSKTFQERKALRAAARGKPRVAAERGRWIFSREIDGERVDFHAGDPVEFVGIEDGERTLITGVLIEKKRGADEAKIEQDDTDSVWSVAYPFISPIKQDRSRKAKSERKAARQARLAMRSKRKEAMGLVRPPRPPRLTPAPRPAPPAPRPAAPASARLDEGVFNALDRKLARLRSGTARSKAATVVAALGADRPAVWEGIYRAAAYSGAEPHFDAEKRQITLVGSHFTGTAKVNRTTQQIELRLSRLRAPSGWGEAVVGVLQDHGLQGHIH
jgi:hypothetical protein